MGCGYFISGWLVKRRGMWGVKELKMRTEEKVDEGVRLLTMVLRFAGFLSPRWLIKGEFFEEVFDANMLLVIIGDL
ncbi:hypothetical protein AKJ16_DCAP23187 [Drosera capensis]